MEGIEGNLETMSKSPLTSNSDMHEVMAGALSAHPGQHFKISLGTPTGKIEKPPLKLRRAGDISLSSAIPSPAVEMLEGDEIISSDS